MTYVYEWFSLPDEVDITCPNCHGHAKFYRAKVLAIRQKSHISYFENNPKFDCMPLNRLYHHATTNYGAIYYPKLFSTIELKNDDLPKGYELAHFYLDNDNLGTLVCPSCGIRCKHKLDWEKDAFYQTNVKNQQLWAFHRQHLLTIKQFIESTAQRKNSLDTLHLPTIFKRQKNREEVIKKINQLLRK